MILNEKELMNLSCFYRSERQIKIETESYDCHR